MNGDARRALVVLPVAVILCLVLVLGPQAGATEVNIFRGQIAFSFFFESFDESGCIATQARTVATDAKFHSPPGPPVAVSNAFVEILQHDLCLNATLSLFNGVVDLAPDEFQIASNGSSATFDATVQLCNQFEPFNCIPVTVDLTWTATGPVFVDTFTSHENGIFHFVQHVAQRPAQVAGVISDGVVNYTPNPTDGILTLQGDFQVTRP